MQTRKATNRNKLIKAAANLIERDGYKNIDVTKVTKEAKLGYGTFYNHFSDITDLFEEITLLFFSLLRLNISLINCSSFL